MDQPKDLGPVDLSVLRHHLDRVEQLSEELGRMVGGAEQERREREQAVIEAARSWVAGITDNPVAWAGYQDHALIEAVLAMDHFDGGLVEKGTGKNFYAEQLASIRRLGDAIAKKREEVERTFPSGVFAPPPRETLSRLAAQAYEERDDAQAGRRWLPPSPDTDEAAEGLVMSSPLAEWFPDQPWRVVEVRLIGGQVEAVVVVDPQEDSSDDQPHLMVTEVEPSDGPPDDAWHSTFTVKLAGRRARWTVDRGEHHDWDGVVVQDAAHLGELLATRGRG